MPKRGRQAVPRLWGPAEVPDRHHQPRHRVQRPHRGRDKPGPAEEPHAVPDDHHARTVIGAPPKPVGTSTTVSWLDYVGLGGGFARAMAPANPDQERRSIDVEGLIDTFEAELKVAMTRFAGIDQSGSSTLSVVKAGEGPQGWCAIWCAAQRVSPCIWMS